MDSAQGALFFRPIQLRPAKPRQDTSSPGEPAAAEDRGLYCRACSAHITDLNQAINIDGRHEHAFFNPAGITFEIRCFQTAPGVLSLGEPSSEFSWFPGFAWQIVLCHNCRAHLGWRFIDEIVTQVFFGLIAPRLRSK
nr:cereblon family protein [uncultured Desulfobulbus sp.]